MRLADGGARRYVRASIKPKLVSSTSTSCHSRVLAAAGERQDPRPAGSLPDSVRFDQRGEDIILDGVCTMCLCPSL